MITHYRPQKNSKQRLPFKALFCLAQVTFLSSHVPYDLPLPCKLLPAKTRPLVWAVRQPSVFRPITPSLWNACFLFVSVCCVFCSYFEGWNIPIHKVLLTTRPFRSPLFSPPLAKIHLSHHPHHTHTCYYDDLVMADITFKTALCVCANCDLHKDIKPKGQVKTVTHLTLHSPRRAPPHMTMATQRGVFFYFLRRLGLTAYAALVIGMGVF